MLKKILQENGFTEKEAKIYLSGIELGLAPASSIARNAGENRVTTYTILKELVDKWIALETEKENIKFYSLIDPKKLITLQKTKLAQLEDSLPELFSLTNTFTQKPKTYLYEWLAWLKRMYKEIILSSDEMEDWEKFLTFFNTQNINEEFMNYLLNQFIPWRLKSTRETQSIVFKTDSKYDKYSKEKHSTIFIDKAIFEEGNEVILYGNKVAIAMFNNKELMWMIIESKSLNNIIKNLFYLVRDYENKKEK